MANCLRCGSTLGADDASAGSCTRCGAELLSPKPATVADVRRIDQTMDLGPSGDEESAGAAADKPGTVNDVRHLGTLDVPPADLPSLRAAAEEKPGTVDDVRHHGTFDADAAGLGSQDAHQLQSIGNLSMLFGDDASDQPSAPQPQSAKQPGKGTEHDHANLAKTFDSVGNDLVENLSLAWGEQFAAPGSPHVTIKGREAGAGRGDQTLVINARAVRHAAKSEPGGAIATKLADYELLSLLGEGGMGVVYTARQASIDRTVAVKMLKPAMSRNKDLQAKFLSEAVVTGDLDHPNIVPMYDLGKNEAGDLFYAMKKVQGTPWSKAIGAKSQQENIEILLKAADAVAFAHSRGVIHRDLKPENIMLGEFGEVLVMDWGLAYSTAEFRKSGSITQTHSMGGSPAYMAPEMATGPINRITFASDIYLLGAILYEILTGKPPHSGSNVSQCLMAAARNDILPTDKTGELVEVSRRAMATAQNDRYESVRAFQAAIRECLAHSESLALTSRAEQELSKARETNDYQAFARSVFGYEEAFALWKENDRAAAGIHEVRLAYADAAYGKGDYDLAAGLLERSRADHGELLEKIGKAQREREARQVRLRRAKRFVAALLVAVLIVGGVAYFGIRTQRDRALLAEDAAKVERDNALIQEQEAAKQRDRAIAQEKEAARQRDKAIEQEKEAAVQRDKAIAQEKEAAKQRDLAVKSEREAQAAKAAEEYAAYGARIGLANARIEENAFDSALQLLDTCPEHLRNWEWARLKYLCERSTKTFRAEAPLNAVALDAGAKRCAGVGEGGTVRIWSLERDEPVVVLPYADCAVNGVAFSPDGKLLAVGGADSEASIRLYELSGDRKSHDIRSGGTVTSAAFNAAGDGLLTTCADGTARIWNTKDRSELHFFHGHSSAVNGAALSPDEKTLITVGDDDSAVVWHAPFPKRPAGGGAAALSRKRDEVSAMLEHNCPVKAVAFSPLGDLVATGGADGRILLWKPADVVPYRLADAVKDEPRPSIARPLLGHTKAVRSVAFSQDGRRLVSGGLDNALIVWDVAEGKPIKQLRGHAGQVHACRFTPDDRFIVSAGYDGTVRVWNVDDYQESVVLKPQLVEGHSDAVLAADFSPDETSIVTAGRDRTARISDLKSLKNTAVLDEGHEFLASAAAVSRDGKLLVTAAVDGTARMWNVETGGELAVVPDTARSAAVALSLDGRKLFVGDRRRRQTIDKQGNAVEIEESGAKLWDIAEGRTLLALPAHASEVAAVAISPDGKRLFTGERTGRVSVWDAATGDKLWSKLVHTRSITAAMFTDDGRELLTASLDQTVGRWNADDGDERVELIWKHAGGVKSLARVSATQAATACEDGKVRLWNLDSAQPVAELELPVADYAALSASADGRYLAAVEHSPTEAASHSRHAGLVRLIDVATRRAVQLPGRPAGSAWFDAGGHSSPVWSAAMLPDGSGLVTVGGDEAQLWNRTDGARRQTYRSHAVVAGCAYAPGGKEVATAGWDGSVKIWNVASGRVVRKLLRGHRGPVNAVSYSPDGKQIVTAGRDGSVRLWDAVSGMELSQLIGHEGAVNSATFSTDGTLIVSGGSDKSARIWNVATRDLLHKLAHDGAVLSAAISHDGATVVTGCADNTAQVWDAARGTRRRILTGHTGPVNCAAVDYDGSRVVTCSRDGGVKLWDAVAGKELLSLKQPGRVARGVNVVRFSPSGKTILSAGEDGVVVLWPTSDAWQPRRKLAPAAEQQTAWARRNR